MVHFSKKERFLIVHNRGYCRINSEENTMNLFVTFIFALILNPPADFLILWGKSWIKEFTRKVNYRNWVIGIRTQDRVTRFYDDSLWKVKKSVAALLRAVVYPFSFLLLFGLLQFFPVKFWWCFCSIWVERCLEK